MNIEQYFPLAGPIVAVILWFIGELWTAHDSRLRARKTAAWEMLMQHQRHGTDGFTAAITAIPQHFTGCEEVINAWRLFMHESGSPDQSGSNLQQAMDKLLHALSDQTKLGWTDVFIRQSSFYSRGQMSSSNLDQVTKLSSIAIASSLPDSCDLMNAMLKTASTKEVSAEGILATSAEFARITSDKHRKEKP